MRADKLVSVQKKMDMEAGYPSIVAVKVPRRANVFLGNVCAARMWEMKEPDVLSYIYAS